MKIKHSNLIAFAIIGIALALALTSVWDDAPIVDEIPHIGAGYSYIAKMDARLNPEHPPLAKDLAGIALKMADINDEAAFNSRFWQQDINGQWEFGRRLIFNSNNDANQVSHVAKLPILIFFIFSAIIVFKWTKEISGKGAGLLALFLFAFSPTVLAHSRFVTTDVPALFGVLLASYFFVRYLKNQTNKNLIYAGLALGVAELTKFSLFLLVPFFIVLAITYAFLNSSKSKFRDALYLLLTTACVVAIAYIFVVWPIYVFHIWNYPPELQHYHTEEILSTYGRRWIADTVVYLSDKPIIRGLSEYGLGLLMVTQRSVGGNTTYFMGEIRNWAWPQYFPIVYFIKEPLAFWALIITVWLFFSSRMKSLNPKKCIRESIHWAKNNFDKFAMVIWLVLYWYVSIRANLNIGVRHLMPIYGFTYILLAGGLVGIYKLIENKKRILIAYTCFVVILFGWYLYENLNVYPFYLTYFNQIVGGPSGGHLYVVDSNLDWGQDLKRLSDWVDKNNIQKISLDYFGWSDQTYYLKDKLVWIWAGKYNNEQSFLDDNPNGGYIAVSATFYMGSREKPETSYAWLENYKPVAIIGNSIFVWYIPPLR